MQRNTKDTNQLGRQDIHPSIKHLVFCFFAGFFIMFLNEEIDGSLKSVGIYCGFVFFSWVFSKGVIGLVNDFRKWRKEFLNGD